MGFFDRIKGTVRGKPNVASSYSITDDGDEELAKRLNKGDPDTIVLLSLRVGGNTSPRSISRDTGLSIEKVEKSLSRLDRQGLIRPIGSPHDYD